MMESENVEKRRKRCLFEVKLVVDDETKTL